MSYLFLNIYDFFRKRRWLLALIVIVVTVVAAYLTWSIRFEENITRFLPKDEKIKKITDVFEKLKTNEKLFIMVSAADTTAKADTDRLIAYADELSASLKDKLQPKYISEITGKITGNLMNDIWDLFHRNLPVFLEDEDYQKIRKMISRQAIDSSISRDFRTLMTPAGTVMKGFIAADPLGFTSLGLKKLGYLKVDEGFQIFGDHIFSKDLKHLLIVINTSNPPSETSQNSELLDVIDEQIKDMNLNSGGYVRAEYYGATAVAVGNARQLKKDSLITIIIAVVVLLVFLSYFFRNKRTLVFMLLPVAFGALVALAIIYLIKAEISTIAIGSGSIILGIAINYSLHFYTHYRHTRNVREVIRDLAAPLTIGSTTTIGAFLGLLLVRSEALSDFGLLSALCLIGAVIFTLVVLPFLVKKPGKDKDIRHHYNFIDKLSAYKFENNKVLLIIILILSVVFIFTARKVEFESDMSKMNYMSGDLQYAERNLTAISDSSLKSLYLVSTGPDLDKALLANEKVCNEVDKLKSRNLIKSSTSVNSILISDSVQRQRIMKWEQFWTISKKDSLLGNIRDAAINNGFREDAFAGFVLLMNTKFVPMSNADKEQMKKTFLDEFITELPDKAMVVSVLKINDSRKQAVLDNLPEQENLVIIDKQQMAARFSEIISDDFNIILLVSSLLVFIFLLISYGRIELTLIAFLPMLISWIWILGLMGMFGLKFNVVSIIISAFIFGLGDDYSIFIMDGLLQEYRTGRKFLPSYKTAVFLSAFTMVVGVGVLVFAKHPALRSVAWLTIIGMLSVVVISYTVAPVIFRWMIWSGKKKRTMPVTFFHVIYALVCYSYFFLGCAITVFAGWTILKVFPFRKRQRQLAYHWLLWIVSRSTMYIMFLPKKRIINFNKETFAKPAVIVSNHQSLIDIPLGLMFSPKVIMLTNDRVWNNFLIGRVVRLGGFFPTSTGSDTIITRYQEKVDQGYSLMVFPEGTRSKDKTIGRFHKGAFYIAEQMGLDILPMVVSGTSDYIAKGEMLGRKSTITVKFLDRIKPGRVILGEGYKEKARNVRRLIAKEHQHLLDDVRNPAYFRDLLIRNYIYKGPILEWYLRVKLKMEKCYKPFHDLIPLNARITDIGCGYGFLSLMLGLLSNERQIRGIDYDEEKVDLARHCISLPDNVVFSHEDAVDYSPQLEQDVYIFSDVLHYMPEQEQEKLVRRCIEKLGNGGMVIIRDADNGLGRRQKRTELTEFFSTRLGFNKARYKKLFFTSRKAIEAISASQELSLEIIDNTRFTSNLFYVIRKNS